MMNFQQFVGSITSESVRKQQYRKRTKQGQEWDIVSEERHLCDGETTNQRQSSDGQVTEQGQVNSSVVQGERQGDSSSVTLEWQTCPSEVTSESPVNDSDLPQDGQQNDNKVTEDGQEKPFLPLLFGHLPRDGEPPENIVKCTSTRIRKPKKMGKSEEESLTSNICADSKETSK